MLTITSGNQCDGIEQELGMQEKGDFQDELRQLESEIRKLSSIKNSPDNKRLYQKHGSRSFGLQKLRIRRMTKKRNASANVEETTNTDVIKRVKELQIICKDLSGSINAASAVKSPKMESRDDDEMLLTGRGNDELERVTGDRIEILQAIAACADVLSNFSVDLKISKHSMNNFENFVNEIEITESKFIQTNIDTEISKKLTEDVERLGDEVEITESKFLDIETSKELREYVEKSADKIEATEKKFLETKVDTVTSNQSTQNTDAFMCYDINDCRIIEAIENLVTSLVIGENTEDDQETICENVEEKSSHDYFCGISKLWNITQDVEASLEESSSPTEKEASIKSMASIVTTECRTNHTEHRKNTTECSTEDPKIDTIHTTTPNEYKIYPTEEKNQTDENPEKEADPTNKNSEKENFQKQEENPENDDNFQTSFHCDFFNSLCSLTRKNTDTEEVENSEKEDKTGTSSDCAFFDSTNEDDVGTLLDDNFFDSLGLLTRANTDAEAMKKSEKEDEVGASLDRNIFDSPCSSTRTNENEIEISSDCNFFDSLGSLTRTNTDAEAMRGLEKEGEVEQSLDCIFFDSQCLLTRTNEDEVGTSLNYGFSDSPCSLTRTNTDTEAVETSKEKNLEEKPKQNAKFHDFADSDEQEQNDETVTKEESKKKLENLETAKRHCITTITSMDGIKKDCSAVEFQGNMPAECNIKTVTSMDFIPRFEVIGCKRWNKQAHDKGTSKNKTPDTMDIMEKEESTEEKDQRQIASVSSMDFIPRLEVVGFKESRDSNESKQKGTWPMLKRQSRHDKEGTAPREGKAKTKERVSKEKVLETRTKTTSRRGTRRMAAKTRRNGRRLKQQLSRGNRSADALHIGTIQEDPEQLEQVTIHSVNAIKKIDTKGNAINRNIHKTLRKNTADEFPSLLVVGTIQEDPEQSEQVSNYSVNAIKKIDTKGNAIHHNIHKTSRKRTADEFPPPLVVQDQVVRATPDNTEFENLPRKDDAVPIDVHKARIAPQLHEGTQDSASRLCMSGHRQAPVDVRALLDTATSSLSTWTGNKSTFKESSIKQREDRDGNDYENRQKSKPWFFQAKEEHSDIVECLSPVFSIPTQSTFGTRNDEGDNEDNEYINRYYDFGEDDVGSDYDEYDDDYEYDYEYNDAVDREDCYVCDSY